MNLPSSTKLNIGQLSRLFDNMSESYKIFWFQAIVDVIAEGKTFATYDELINAMIADAWYMVSEYKLNLGPSDTLEKVVHYAYQISGLQSNAKRSDILEKIEESTDSELIAKKKTLTLNVPYRLQAPFMPQMKGKAWDGGAKSVAESINRHDYLIYYFERISGLDSEIRFNEKWVEYIKENIGIIRGWIQFNLIMYLQRRNPSVPGIAYKINPPEARKMEKVKTYWKTVNKFTPITEIYGDFLLVNNDISIDHFVPWSYVAHDELWNLHPTRKGINSSKSNNLADWNLYFDKLGILEFEAFELAQRNAEVRSSFEKCLKDHVNDEEVRSNLYRNGISKEAFIGKLKDVIEPAYLSAERMGFNLWTYRGCENE